MPIRTGSEAEFRAGVTLASRVAGANPFALSQIYYNVLSYGADNSGATDNTAIYNAIFALAPSGVIFFPPGLYKGQILYPATPDARTSNWHLLGSGIHSTFLIPPASNTEILTKLDRTGITEGVTVAGFTVKAHASGSTGTAIDLAGFRSCQFSHVGYSSNAGGDFASLFHLSAGQMRCYANKIMHVVIDGGTVANTGPAIVILFDSKNDAGVSQGLNFTANDCDIEDVFCYSNSGITTIIDALRSAAVGIRDCFFESNGVGCTAIIAGTKSVIEDSHFEANITTDTIKYDSVALEGTSNATVVRNNEFSDLTAITFPATCQDNIWRDNLLDVPCTFTNLGLNNTVWNGAQYIAGLSTYANNAAALGGGEVVGCRYLVTASDPGVIAVVT